LRAPAPSTEVTETIDENGMRGLAVLVLQTYGYKVLAASNGTEALRLVEKRSSGLDSW
jgi:CheY-like chemotaxis protein